MRKGALALALLSALGLTGCAAPAETPAVGLCYRITGGKNPMVILGSIHVGNESMRHFAKPLAQALEDADTLVFECDNQSAAAKAEVQEMMKARQPLSQLISTDTLALLEQTCQKLGYRMEAFEDLRPWAVTSTLSTRIAAEELEAASASQALKLGVESTVWSSAGSRAIAYLETAREQLEILDGFSPELQETLLLQACQLALEPQSTGVENWPGWWQEGNEEAFAKAYGEESSLTDPALAKEYHQKLVTERNQKMAQGLQALLEGEDPHHYFVTIGLLHLVLPGDSVLSQLEAMGYTVERLLPED